MQFSLWMMLCFQVNSAWENLDKTWKERVERLEEAMQAAVQFQDGLQVLGSHTETCEGVNWLSSSKTQMQTVKRYIKLKLIAFLLLFIAYPVIE